MGSKLLDDGVPFKGDSCKRKGNKDEEDDGSDFDGIGFRMHGDSPIDSLHGGRAGKTDPIEVEFAYA